MAIQKRTCPWKISIVRRSKRKISNLDPYGLRARVLILNPHLRDKKFFDPSKGFVTIDFIFSYIFTRKRAERHVYGF